MLIYPHSVRKEDIYFSDNGFESIVPMQSSLDHNLKQILDEKLINRLKTIKTIQPNVRFRLYVKAGADGSSGHISYQNMGELVFVFRLLVPAGSLQSIFFSLSVVRQV